MSAHDAGRVVWLTGLPASGKTTIAERLVARLDDAGVAHLWLDSDDLRAAFTPKASYDEADRDRFYLGLAHLAILGARGGVTVVVSATAPKRAYRDGVRREVPRLFEVHVVAPAEVLEARDPKGLYARVARGEIATLPGRGAAYEPPLRPELVVDTEATSPDDAAERIFTALGV